MRLAVNVRVLHDGEPAVILVHPEQETRVLLIPERKYGKRGKLRNISYEQRPNVAVEIHSAQGAPRVLVFDSKYQRGAQGERGIGA
jgi:hypothetical protein